MKKYYVYEYSDPRNNKVFYVGKGKNNRYKTHLQPARLKDKSPKSQLILELLSEGILPEITIKKYFTSETDALNYEMEIIEHYGVNNLTNKTTGGQGTSGIRSWWIGKTHTEEAKEKLRQSQLGKNNNMAGDKWHRTPEGCESFAKKMSGKNHPLYGIGHTEETKATISRKYSGLRLTEEQKQTRSKNMKDVWKKRKELGIKINRPKRIKRYVGTIIYQSGRVQRVNCLRDFCDNTNLSFRVLYNTRNSKKFLESGKTKGMRFEAG